MMRGPAHFKRHATRGRLTRPARARRGAALVEGAIILSVFLTIVFFMFDFGLAVLRLNTLSESSRRLARAAMVRGEKAEPELTAWGPARYTSTAAANSTIAATVRSGLVTLDPAAVSIEVTWPDGGNATGDRVETVLTYRHRSILPFLFGPTPLELRSESTMRIEH